MAKRRGKGEGSIRKRKDGRWEASVTVGVTKRGHPKRRYVYGKTRAKVARELPELLVKQAGGTLTNPSGITLGEWLERWLKDKTHLTEKTRAVYWTGAKALN